VVVAVRYPQVFLLVLALPGSPRQRAVKRLLLLLYPQVAGANLNFIRCFVIPELNGLLLYVFICVILSSAKFNVMF